MSVLEIARQAAHAPTMTLATNLGSDCWRSSARTTLRTGRATCSAPPAANCTIITVYREVARGDPRAQHPPRTAADATDDNAVATAVATATRSLTLQMICCLLCTLQAR